jgi:type VI protein secretion system component VasK
MNGWWSPVLMQAGNPLEPLDTVGPTGGLILQDVLLITGVGLVLLVLLAWWAKVYVRRRKRRRHHSQPAILQRTQQGDQAAEGRRHRPRRRRRRHRQDHQARNPTLAETGGLPPIRPDPPARPTV